MPTLKGMSAKGCKLVGVLHAELMIENKSGMPKLIKYNVRFGDPECQVLMVRLESDLVQVMLAACRGELSGVSLDWSPGSAMVVVMASRGNHKSYKEGTIIENLEAVEVVAPDIKIFHDEGRFIQASWHIFGVTAKGNDLEELLDRAYQAVENVKGSGDFYGRRHIGWRPLSLRQHSP